ncbi:MAG TPA: glycosyltransferase family 4 protein [Candidatus Saccharimonadales bacterium]|nr:glycosyltransferase family 4 protein [Candidatus Saccharimonadales bacterium]
MADRDNPLKVGLVLDSGLDSLDGVQQYVLAIGKWLTLNGHEVHYLVGQTKRTDIANVQSLSRNIKVSFNGNTGTIPLLSNKRKIQKLLAIEQFNILHVQVPHHPWLAQRIILAADPSTAIIGTFHIAPFNWLSMFGNKLLRVWLRPSLKRFDQIVSVSSAAADFASQTFDISTEVLPNVIDYPRFHEAKPLKILLNKDKINILFLGRLVERKGCQLLLEAALIISRRSPRLNFRLLICGTGPLEKRLRSYSKQYNMGKIVQFEGYVSESDKPNYYASSDISVFPSTGGESFGIVLAEAMASGHSVVLAGDNPGYRSVMQEQPNLLFNAKDSTELANKLEYFMTHDQESKAMKKWAAAHAKIYDVNTVGHQLIKIYSRALRNRNVR